MSAARDSFLESLSGVAEAINLQPLAEGSAINGPSLGLSVLRRGILISSWIILETFIRDRTSEILIALERWPRSFEDLPTGLRHSARFAALPHLQQFARLLKREDLDYERELKDELSKMASDNGSVQRFTKFVSGDHTGNLSDDSIKTLLSSLQVADCWNTFRSFSSEVGFGVPSVQEIVKNYVRRRHKSAHSSKFLPAASDISESVWELHVGGSAKQIPAHRDQDHGL